MDYIGWIRRGWEISWNNKYLWILGFLAALTGGTSATNFRTSGDEMGAAGVSPEMVGTIAAGLTLAACVGLILGILLWLVSLAAKGGLIGAVARIDRGVPVEGFGQAFRIGWHKVWRLAALSIVLFGIVIVLVIGLVLLFVLSGGALAALFGTGGDESALFAGLGILGLCLLAFLCLMIPLFIFLSLIYPFAMRGMILRDMGVGDAIRHGYQVLRDNLGIILLLSLAFLILNIVVGIITLIVLLPLGLAVAIPTGLLADTNATFLQGLIIVLGALAATAITALVSALVVTWQSSTFTLAYMEFTGKNFDVEAVV